MRSLEQVNIRTNVRTYVRTYSHTYVRDRPYIPSTTLLCEGIISGRRNESMWPDWVSKPGPLPLESDAQPTALRGPAVCVCVCGGGGEREREGVPIQSCLWWEILL